MRFLSVLPLLLLSACAVREVKPTEAEMGRVEAALQVTPCATQLGDWDRHYYYRPRYFAEEIAAAKKEGRPPRSSNRVTSVVQFDLVPARADPPGARKSHAVPPHALTGVTGGLHGAYHLDTGELNLAGCPVEPATVGGSDTP